MSGLPAIRGDTKLALMPASPSRNVKSRILSFESYQAEQGRPWHEPDLAGWALELLDSGMKPASVKSCLGTVRGGYRRIDQNALRQALYGMAPAGVSAADNKAFVDEVLVRLENATRPEAVTISAPTAQDRPDSDHLRLTKAHADALMQAPGVTTLRGLRDTALIALALCTGVRMGELAALDVPDLRQKLGGSLALHVRHGKGDKSRLILYGDLDWVLVIVDRWLAAAGIESGPVFRGQFKGDSLRPGRLSVRAIEYIVGAYPLSVGGSLVTVKPHDLRRTYARRLYVAGVDLVAIQQNLGHSDSKTTLKYIGVLDASMPQPPAVYSFDLGGLTGLTGEEGGL